MTIFTVDQIVWPPITFDNEAITRYFLWYNNFGTENIRAMKSLNEHIRQTERQSLNHAGKNTRYLLLIVCWLCMAMGLIAPACNDPEIPEKHADVAIYSDNGVWKESLSAAEKMFQWMGYSVVLVNAEYVNKRGLETFRIICIPGGNMYEYSERLSSQGRENIVSFVAGGGGYIGICGGAYYAAEKIVWRGSELSMVSLGIFKGAAIGPIEEIIPYPNFCMCEISVTDTLHPITRFEKSPLYILYYWGPALIPSDSLNSLILGRYVIGGKSAFLADKYGSGRIFLIGTHPEIEEDNDRDGVEFGEELDDNGSDWELMKKATLWCVKK